MRIKLINPPVYAFERNAHEGMHIEVRKGIMEIVGDAEKQFSHGKQGRIVCTGFNNLIMLLIRYDMGDVGTISDIPCSCGRGLPLLKSVAGRSSEVLRYKNKIIYPSMLSVILEQYDNIKECQFVQEKEDTMKVNVVQSAMYSAKDTEKLVKNLKHIIDEDIVPEISFVDGIPRTHMGKF